MPPTGVKSAKRKRQYEHIKSSAKKRGTSTKRAKEIAARTVNKQRAQAGQTQGSAKKRSTAKRSTKKSTASRKSAAKRTTRKSSSRKTTRKSSAKKR